MTIFAIFKFIGLVLVCLMLFYDCQFLFINYYSSVMPVPSRFEIILSAGRAVGALVFILSNLGLMALR